MRKKITKHENTQRTSDKYRAYKGEGKKKQE